jgi:mRNA deadenylase 3'-5' endonuclease subunit Ccr4
MEKRNALPKGFLEMLKRLKRLDDDLGISVNLVKKKQIQKWDKEKVRKQTLEKIWENWPRKTLLSKDVLQMRSNALKNPKIKAILNKYHIQIENCALVDLRCERHFGSSAEWECPAYTSPESILEHLQETNFGNIWKSTLDYYWGGPKDQIKILFQQSNNNRFKVIGLIEMFPERKAA